MDENDREKFEIQANEVRKNFQKKWKSFKNRTKNDTKVKWQTTSQLMGQESKYTSWYLILDFLWFKV